LASTAVPVDTPSGSLGVVHADEPPIVHSDGGKRVSIRGLEHVSEVGNGCADIVHDVLAVAIWSIGTFFLMIRKVMSKIEAHSIDDNNRKYILYLLD
jgi:hypothetical protein